jgi:hypothetical protein
MSRADIAVIVTALGELARVVREADPADRADIYAKLGLTLTYQPGERLVEATIKPGLSMRRGFVSEGELEPGNAGCFPESGRGLGQQPGGQVLGTDQRLSPGNDAGDTGGDGGG